MRNEQDWGLDLCDVGGGGGNVNSGEGFLDVDIVGP